MAVPLQEPQPQNQADWDALREKNRQALPEALKEAAKDSLPSLLLLYQGKLLKALERYSFVVCEKSRRIGMTWGVGAAAVLTAAAARGQGGMDALYLGFNLDMARDFIDVCAMWAKAFSLGAAAVQEFLFEDQDKDGGTRQIQAFRIRFASGFEIVALTSKPRSLRGRQGLVILDEAAFHDDLAEVLKAALALLIWGGKVLVISTHDGIDNAFNGLVDEIRAGKREGATVLRVTFKEALADGLYRRICLVQGKDWSQADEDAWAANIYGLYGDGAEEELDVVPSKGGGAYLTAALVAACEDPDIPVLRYAQPDSFVELPKHLRQAEVADWLARDVDPILARLTANSRHVLGGDFGRKGHLSVFNVLEETLQRDQPSRLVVELRNIPFDQQRQILWHILRRLPRFGGAALDAGGNGAQLAEETQQEFGSGIIHAVMLTTKWYREEMPGCKAAFEDRSTTVPRDRDVQADYRLVEMRGGVARMSDRETIGADGGKRHGDAAMGHFLALYAGRTQVLAYGFETLGSPSNDRGRDDDPDDRDGPSTRRRFAGLGRREAW